MNQIRLENPVIWIDGMLVENVHFQQMERYLSSELRSLMLIGQRYFWGFLSLEINKEQLLAKNLKLEQVSCLFGDGTQFDSASFEKKFLKCSLKNAVAGDIFVIAIKSANVNNIDCLLDSQPDEARYTVHETKIIDRVRRQSSLGGPRAIDVLTGLLNVRLCDINEVLDDEVYLPILKLALADSGLGFVSDQSFLAPMLDSHNCDYLSRVMEEVCSYFDTKLVDRQSDVEMIIEGSMSSILGLLLRQTLSEFQCKFLMLKQTYPLHPMVLFSEILSFLGNIRGLYLGSLNSVNVDHKYMHEDLFQSFEGLLSSVRVCLAKYLRLPVVRLGFEQHNAQLYVCSKSVNNEIEKYIFSVAAAAGVDHIREAFTRMVKFSSVDNIQSIVDLQLPGAKFKVLNGIPRDVPHFPGRCYFEVDINQENIDLLRGGALALHVVGDLPGFVFDCWAVRTTAGL
jgi:type VI secretion system protein ImpJ